MHQCLSCADFAFVLMVGVIVKISVRVCRFPVDADVELVESWKKRWKPSRSHATLVLV